MVNIPINSDLEKQITLFINNNQNGWKPLFFTYKPGLMIYGDNFKLILDDNGPILEYWPEKNKQYGGIKSKSQEMQKLKDDLLIFINNGS